MMRLRIYLLVVVFLGLGCLASLSAYSQRRQPPAWEYKVVESDTRVAEGDINTFAKQGWELVSVQQMGSSRVMFYLKRAK